MRICFNSLFINPVPPTKGGAIEIMTYELAKQLTQLGDDVCVISSKSQGPSSHFIEHNVDFYQFNHRVSYAGCAKFLMQFKDFDILHMMGRHAAIPSLPARKSSFKKKIYHVHNIYPWGMRGDTRPINYYKDLLYERIATNISDEVIVPSTYLVNLVSRVSLKPQNKVCVLPNGVDPEKFNPDINGRGIRKRYSLGDSTVITYIGRITPLKGIHHLIEAFSLLKKDLFNVRLFIIGPIWRPNYYTYLCNLIKDLKLNGSVMFTGPVKHELIPNYLAATDIFVFPTLGEGFGLSLLEAMACGKPVITSNVAGVSSLVIDQVTGLLVKPADEHQICQRLRWLIHNKDFTEKMGLNASSYVTKHFSLSAIAKRLRGIYEQMGA